MYVLQGTITDHRDGVATDYGPGLGWPEDRNTTHWLENRGTIPAVEISVDIVTGTECELSDVKIGALCWNQYTTWPDLLAAGRRADRLGYRLAVDVGPPVPDRRQLRRTDVRGAG